MKKYIVNLDYEFKLENGRKPNNKLDQLFSEFEYVFFLTEAERCVLKNKKNYTEEYLNRIEQLGFTIPVFSPEAKSSNNWWGALRKINVEKKLNSKITAAQIGMDLGVAPRGTKIINSMNDLEGKENKHILKSEFGFSGRGVKILNQDSIKWAEKLINNNKMLVMQPNLNRILDFGVSYKQKSGTYFITKNIVSSSGRFLGGISLDKIDDLNIFLEIASDTERQIELVITRILKEGATEDFQFDCFFYEEGNELKLNPLVEINYRKTMGDVIYQMKSKLGQGAWIISKGPLEGKLVSQSPLELSPKGNNLKSYYIRSSNFEFLEHFCHRRKV